jgi:hypothetical protein
LVSSGQKEGAIVTIQYQWHIGPFDVKLSENGLDKVVCGVHWRLNGEEGGMQSSIYGSLGLPAPESDNFTPFEKLTKEMVIGWVESYLGDDRIAEFKSGIANDIEKQRNPVEVTVQPPWGE